jgi:hypothetical protein
MTLFHPIQFVDIDWVKIRKVHSEVDNSESRKRYYSNRSKKGAETKKRNRELMSSKKKDERKV